MPDAGTVDRMLMQRLQEGDLKALRDLIDRWQSPLLSFTYRYLQDREAARDITLETFVRIYDARTRYRFECRFSTWLFKIASNLCKNQLRWRKRHPEEPLPEEQESGLSERKLQDQEDPADLAVEHERVDAVRRAVASLPHKLKVAVLLHYYEDMGYREIADVCGCSERGVESRLYRARKLLGDALARQPRDKSFSGGRARPFVPREAFQ